MRKITVADWKPTLYQYYLILRALLSKRLTYGKLTQKLEEDFAEIHCRQYAMFTNSGTSSLQIAIHALREKHGWKDGDEIIMPALTFVATMNVILYNNLKPVFVDVNLNDLNIDPNEVEKAITPKTVAIMPVHLLGTSADMKSIMKIADKHGLKVIEDSCESMFVEDSEGFPVGSRGDVACYSSYLAHVMVTGVGGFITTNDEELAKTMRSMMFHGRDDAYLTIDDNGKDPAELVKKRFLFDKQGYSFRATELESALGLGDLKRYKWIIKKRQENAEYLTANMPKGITVPFKNLKNHAFMLFPLLVKNRDRIMLELEKRGIHTRTIMPLTNQPIVKKLFGDIEKDYPNTKYVNDHGILIGCHQYLKRKDLEYIIKSLEEICQK